MDRRKSLRYALEDVCLWPKADIRTESKSPILKSALEKQAEVNVLELENRGGEIEARTYLRGAGL